MKYSISILLLFASTIAFAQTSLTVNIEAVESDEGSIIIALFTSGDGFPADKDKAFRRVRVKASKGPMSHTLTDIPHGSYALSITHDKNDNDEVDRNWIGMPKEPVGASNQKSMGKPSFKRSALTLDSPTQSIDIHFMN